MIYIIVEDTRLLLQCKQLPNVLHNDVLEVIHQVKTDLSLFVIVAVVHNSKPLLYSAYTPPGHWITVTLL